MSAAADAGSEAAVRGGPRRVAFVAALALAMAVGPFFLYAIGALAPLLTVELGITRAQIGMMTTVGMVIAAVLVPFVGRLVDRVGGRRTCVASFALTAGSLVGAALAPTYGWLLVAMAVSGLALSSIEPSTNRLISSHVERREQGIVVGIKQSGVQAGALLAGAGLPAGGLLLGWRGVLLASTALPLLGLLSLVWGVPSDDGAEHRYDPVVARPPLGTAVAWLAGYAFLMGAGLAPASAYLPLYAHERLGLSVTAAGMAAAVIAGVGLLARIAWGHQADRLGPAPMVLGLLAGLSALAQMGIWAAQGGGQTLLWAGAALFGATAGAWNAVAMLVLVRQVDNRLAGRASGLVQSSFYLGWLVSPIAFGASVDATGAYHLGWGGVTGLFLLSGLLMLAWHRSPGGRRLPG